MSNVGYATLSLIPSAKGMGSAIESETSGPLGSAGKKGGGLFGAGFKGAALGIIGGVAAVVGSFAGLYKVGSMFEDVTNTIRVGTGASGDALKGLEDSAKAVATSVPANFETAGSTVADLNTRLGLSGDTLETVASQYIEAGRILGEDVDINTTSKAFSAFGIAGDDVSASMDTLFQISQATGVGMNALASGVSQNAPAVKELGFSFEDTASLVGSLDKAGLDSNRVMSSMSRSLVELAKSGEEPQEAFARTVDEIGGFIESGDKAAAIDLAGKVFGTRGASQFVGAIGDGTLALDDLMEATGATEDTILGLGKETRKAGDSWQIVKNNGLNALEPLASGITDLVGGAMGKLADVAADIGPKVADGIGGIIAKVGPAFSGIFDALGPAIAPLVGAFTDLAPPILGIVSAFSPLGLILKAITPLLPQIAELFTQIAAVLADALGTALAAVAPIMEALAGVLTDVLAAVLPVIAELIGVVANVFATLVPVLVSVLAAVMPLITSLMDSLIPVITELVSSIMPPLIAIFSVVVAAIMPLVTTLADLLIPIIEALLPVVQTVFGVVADVIKSAMRIVRGIIQVVTGIISGNWSQVWTGIGNILGGIWDTIVSVVTGAINIVKSVISAGVNIVSSVWTAAWDGISSFFSGIWDGIVDGVSTGIDNVMSFFSGLQGRVMDALSGAGEWLLDVGSNIIDGLIGGITDADSAIFGAILGPIQGAVEGVKNFLGINSPSRLFREIGGFTGEGMAIGLHDSAGLIAKASDALIPRVPTVPSMAGSAALGIAGPLGSHASADTNVEFNYTQNGGDGLTSDQEVRRAAQRLKRSLRK